MAPKKKTILSGFYQRGILSKWDFGHFSNRRAEKNTFKNDNAQSESRVHFVLTARVRPTKISIRACEGLRYIYCTRSVLLSNTVQKLKIAGRAPGETE